MALKNYKHILRETPDDEKFFVRDAMDILERLQELLDEKFEGKQKLLADKMGKSEAEVSKILSGVQNFTLKTLSKLKAAFGEPIIAVCTNHYNATFVQVKTTNSSLHHVVKANKEGSLSEQKFKPVVKSTSSPKLRKPTIA